MPLVHDFFDTRSRHWRARLAISVDVMKELSRYSDPAEMHRVFARRMGQLFPTARQLTLSRRGLTKPEFRVTKFNLWPDGPERKALHAGGLLADLLYAGEPKLVNDLALAAGDPAAEYLDGQGSLLAIPVYDQGTAVTMLVLTREEPDAFHPEQVPELVWMTNLFGRATQSLVLSHALKGAYDAAAVETKAIADIQQSLLPAALPTVPGLDLAVHYRAARGAGGDYYDLFPHADGSCTLLVGDVSGSGTPAAVLMAITHTIAHAADAPTTRPGALLAHLNARLAGRSAGAFVTAFAARLDPAADALVYASAGHVPPRLVRAGGVEFLNRVQRLPLGIALPETTYPECHTTFAPGDRLVLFTDGLTEATDPAGDMYGTDRLDARLTADARPAADTVADVLADLEAFTARKATDDRTILVARRG